MCKKIMEKITDLKDMLKKSGKLYGEKTAYKLRENKDDYKIITYKEVCEVVDSLGTALINLGLKNKRIAVIGENRYEWEISYLSVVCGTGIVVPFDKSLPENELERLIERSNVEAIFFSKKYEDVLLRIKNKNENLKFLISMDLEKQTDNIYSQKELIQNGRELIKKGNREFIDAKINPDIMNIMLFTSGTTSESKVVALSHKNICSNVMDLGVAMKIDSNDRVLSFLPLHHVFECTVGFLLSLYKGAQISFCDGIRHILDNLREYKITCAAFVPAIYENSYKTVIRKLEKEGKLEETKKLMSRYKNSSMEEKQKVFKEINNIFGGCVKTFITGAAAIDKNIQDAYRNWGINLCQGYGLTETSPVVAIETAENFRTGSIGLPLPSVEVKLENVNSEGIGELVVKGPTVMLGYYGNEECTKEVLKDGWFYTGDLAKIDDDGYIYISGRKKSVIVLKN